MQEQPLTGVALARARSARQRAEARAFREGIKRQLHDQGNCNSSDCVYCCKDGNCEIGCPHCAPPARKEPEEIEPNPVHPLTDTCSEAGDEKERVAAYVDTCAAHGWSSTDLRNLRSGSHHTDQYTQETLQAKRDIRKMQILLDQITGRSRQIPPSKGREALNNLKNKQSVRDAMAAAQDKRLVIPAGISGEHKVAETVVEMAKLNRVYSNLLVEQMKS